MSRRRCLALAWLLGCGQPADDEATPPSRPRWQVFPTAELVDQGRLALEGLPYATTPIPVERLAWRDGFSPVQTVVLQLDAALDPASLPGLDDVGTLGSVQLWDLDAGAPVPCFAELDAWPGAEAGPRAVLVRPQAPIPRGHRAAVAVTGAVRTADGAPLAPPAWFRAAVDGGEVEGLDGAHYADLVDTLRGLGVQDVVLAADWPVATDPTRPLTAMLDALPTPSAWRWDEVELASSDDLPPGIHKRLSGTFTTTSWLADDAGFTLGEDGLPIPQGTAEAVLRVYVSEGARDAAPGTAPVWLFGHGIFANPDLYLDDDDDGDSVIDLANRAGAIVVATVWRGLTSADIAVPVTVGTDFGRLPELTDKLAQGVANTVALARLVDEGGLLDDPELAGLADPDALSWYGISLGGIHGPIVTARTPAIDHAVFHVGGSTWSTMLERSSNWTSFESLLEVAIPDPDDRQLLYSVSQLWWDPTDPVHWADQLSDRSVLWQAAIGDDQVPNLTTWTVARVAGAPIVGPAAVTPWGLARVEPGVAGPGLTQFDPGKVDHQGDNRPSPVTGAHTEPRRWESCKQQTLAFLDAAAGGVIDDFCDGPCTAPP